MDKTRPVNEILAHFCEVERLIASDHSTRAHTRDALIFRKLGAAPREEGAAAAELLEHVRQARKHIDHAAAQLELLSAELAAIYRAARSRVT